MLQLNFLHFPDITTNRLLLKQPTIADAANVYQMRSDKEVMKYLDRPLAASVDDAVALITSITDLFKKNEAVTWGIYLLEEPQTLVGTIGFWQIQKEHYRAEIGYMLTPAAQGKGLMQEAISAVLHYGFTHLNLHSVEANVNPANEASIRLLERNGFVREAYFRENYYYNGTFVDSAVYSLLTPTALVHSK